MQTNFLRSKTTMLVILAACFAGAVFAQKPKINVTANITANTTWECDKTYFLKGIIYVKNNATLTIQPGTVITGDTTNKGSLVITKGAKIQAVGTPSCPIIFTSSRGPGRRKRGDWGGLILLGKATVNNPNGVGNIEGITPNPDTEFGGGLSPDDHDNSGTLQYVRVEFAGVALSPNNEINGLTFGGVGDGTTIDHIQVSFANDDSYEWFGGKVNAKYIIAFQGLDDDFDTDNGFSGKVQFAMGLRNKKIADISGSKAFESDNDASGSTNVPKTSAIFCNVTASAGGDTTANALYSQGAHIRRNSHLYIYNSIIMGFPAGLLIDGATTEANVLADTMVANNFITCTYAPKYVTTTPVDPSTEALLLDKKVNTFFPGNKKVKLTYPYKLNAPDFRPKSNSPALKAKYVNFKHPVLNDPFFVKVNYVGAFDGTTDWTSGWANWDPDHADYSGACCGGSLNDFAASDVKAVEKNIAAVAVRPNPAKGSFILDLSGFTNKVNIKVSNMTGAVVYKNSQSVLGSKNSMMNINLNNVPTGMYIVEVSDGNKTVTKKVSIIK